MSSVKTKESSYAEALEGVAVYYTRKRTKIVKIKFKGEKMSMKVLLKLKGRVPEQKAIETYLTKLEEL